MWRGGDITVLPLKNASGQTHQIELPVNSLSK